MLADDAEAFAFGDRAQFAPTGVAGGGPAATNRVAFDGDHGEVLPELGSKSTGVSLARDDGCGSTAPAAVATASRCERDPEAVARDVALGYVSIDAALGDYGVHLVADGAVDVDATAAERSRRRG